MAKTKASLLRIFSFWKKNYRDIVGTISINGGIISVDFPTAVIGDVTMHSSNLTLDFNKMKGEFSGKFSSTGTVHDWDFSIIFMDANNNILWTFNGTSSGSLYQYGKDINIHIPDPGAFAVPRIACDSFDGRLIFCHGLKATMSATV